MYIWMSHARYIDRVLSHIYTYIYIGCIYVYMDESCQIHRSSSITHMTPMTDMTPMAVYHRHDTYDSHDTCDRRDTYDSPSLSHTRHLRHDTYDSLSQT